MNRITRCVSCVTLIAASLIVINGAAVSQAETPARQHDRGNVIASPVNISGMAGASFVIPLPSGLSSASGKGGSMVALLSGLSSRARTPTEREQPIRPELSHPGARTSPRSVAPAFFWEGEWSSEQKRHERTRIIACLRLMPARLRAPLQTITVATGPGNPRAIADGHHILIHSVVIENSELCNVLTHEAGHIIDIGLMAGISAEASPFRDGSALVASDDLSVAYYQLSWMNEKQRHRQANPLDFVSQYAMSDSFEDFAESLGLYVRSGKYFRSLLPTSEVLGKKYAFLRDTVFQGQEFDTGTEAQDPYTRHYDATLIGIKYH